jgi:hypothetical protein
MYPPQSVNMRRQRYSVSAGHQKRWNDSIVASQSPHPAQRESVRSLIFGTDMLLTWATKSQSQIAFVQRFIMVLKSDILGRTPLHRPRAEISLALGCEGMYWIGAVPATKNGFPWPSAVKITIPATTMLVKI